MKIRHLGKVKVDCPLRFITHLIGHPMYLIKTHEAIKWKRSDSLKQHNIHGKLKQHAFDIFGVKTLYQGASTSIRNCFSKTLSTSGKSVLEWESRGHCFSRSLADCERRKFDDLTVSDLGTNKNVSLPTLYLLVRVFKTCSMSLVLKRFELQYYYAAT